MERRRLSSLLAAAVLAAAALVALLLPSPHGYAPPGPGWTPNCGHEPDGQIIWCAGVIR